MASDQSFVDYVCEQAGLPGRLSFRKMFGEYALYLDGKVVALVCDNQLYVKPTAPGRAVLGRVSEHPPYPGAKPHYVVEESRIVDMEELPQILIDIAKSLPVKKPKKRAR